MAKRQSLGLLAGLETARSIDLMNRQMGDIAKNLKDVELNVIISEDAKKQIKELAEQAEKINTRSDSKGGGTDVNAPRDQNAIEGVKQQKRLMEQLTAQYGDAKVEIAKFSRDAKTGVASANVEIKESESHVRKLVATFNQAGEIKLGDPKEIYNYQKVISETKKSVNNAANELVRFNKMKADGTAQAHDAERAQLAEQRMVLETANAFRSLDRAKKEGTLSQEEYNSKTAELARSLDEIQQKAGTKIRLVDEKTIEKEGLAAMKEYKALQQEITKLEEVQSKRSLTQDESKMLQEQIQQRDSLVSTIEKSDRASTEYLQTLEQIKNTKIGKEAEAQYQQEKTEIESLQKAYNELEKATLAYDKAVRTHGEAAPQAQLAKRNLDEVNKAYEEQNQRITDIANNPGTHVQSEQAQKAQEEISEKNNRLEETLNYYKEINDAMARQSMGERAQTTGGKELGAIPDIAQMKNANQELDKYVKLLGGTDAQLLKVNQSKGQFVVAQRQADGQIKHTTYSQQKQNGVIRETETSLHQSANRVLDFKNSLKLAAKRMVQWVAVGKLIHGTLRSLREGIGFITELDTELTQVAIIQQTSRESVQGLAKDYVELGREMSKSVAEISRVTTELTRQGLEMEEAQARMQTILKLSSAGMVGVEESLKIITAAVNAMQVTHENAGDVMLRVSQITASSVEQIGEAFSKTASSAHAAGLSMEQTAAMLSGMIQTTQEGASQIGTSLKTILARFNAINQETGELNEDLNRVQTAFESVGITFTDQEGQIRNAYDLLGDLSERWGDLDKNTQSYLATVTAGVRMQSRFFAIMTSFDDIEDSLKEVENSAGVLDEAFETSLTSVEAKARSLKVAIEELWIDTISDEALIKYYELAEAFVTLVNKAGLVRIAIAALTVTLIILANTIRSKLVTSVVELTLSFKKLLAWIKGVTSVSATWNVANLLLIKTFALVIAAVVAATLVYKAFTRDALRDNIEAVEEQIDAQVRMREEAENTLRQFDREEEAIAKANLTMNKASSSAEEVIEAKQTLADIFPSIIDGYNAETGALRINEVELERQIQLRKDLAEAQEGILREASGEEVELRRTQLEMQQQRLDQKKEELENAMASAEEIEDKLLNQNLDVVQRAQLESQLGRLREDISDTREEILGLHDDMYEGAQAVSSAFLGVIPSMENMTDAQQVAFSGLARHMSHADMSLDDFEETLERIAAGEFGDFTELTAEQLEKMAETIEGIEADDLIEAYGGIEEALKKLNEEQEIGIANFEATDEMLEELAEKYAEATDRITDMKELLIELNDAEEISGETKDQIIRQYPELIAFLDDEAQLKIELMKLIELEKEAQIAAYVEKLSYSDQFLNQRLNGEETLREELEKLYNIDLSNAQNLAQAKAKIEEQIINSMGRGWQNYYREQDKMAKANMKQQLQYRHMVEGTMDQYYSNLAELDAIGSSGPVGWDSVVLNPIKSQLDSINLGRLDSRIGDRDKTPSRTPSSGGSEKGGKEFSQEIDLAARSIDNIERKIANLEVLLDNTFASKDRLVVIKELIGLEEERADILNATTNYYEKMAKEAFGKLPKEIQRMVSEQNIQIGTLEISSAKYGEQAEEIYKNVQAYDAMSSAARDSAESLAQVQRQLADLILEESRTEVEAFGRLIDDVRHKTAMLGDEDGLEKLANSAEEIYYSRQQLKAVEDGMTSITRAFRDGRITADQYLTSMRELKTEKQALEQQIYSLEQAQNQYMDTVLGAIGTVESKIIEMIRKRVELEKEALTKNHEQFLKQQNEKIQSYRDELEEFESTVEGKKKALLDEWSEEDFNEELEKEQRKARDIKRQIDELALDDSHWAIERRKELNEDLADQEDKIEKMKRDRKRTIRIDELDEIVETEREITSAKIDTLEKEMETRQKAFDDDMEKLDEQLKAHNLYSEARQAIIKGEFEYINGEMVSLEEAYIDFENRFGAGMGILGDHIKDDFLEEMKTATTHIGESGLEVERVMENALKAGEVAATETSKQIGQSSEEMANAVATAIEKATGASAESVRASKRSAREIEALARSTVDSMTSSGKAGARAVNEASNAAGRSLSNTRKRLQDARRDTEALRREIARLNAELSKKAATKKTQGRQTRASSHGIFDSAYRDGGVITENQLAVLHGSKTDPEYVLNSPQMRGLINNMVGIGQGMKGSDNGGQPVQIGNLLNIEGNVDRDVMPGLQNVEQRVFKKMKELLNVQGIRS